MKIVSYLYGINNTVEDLNKYVIGLQRAVNLENLKPKETTVNLDFDINFQKDCLLDTIHLLKNSLENLEKEVKNAN